MYVESVHQEEGVCAYVCPVSVLSRYVRSKRTPRRRVLQVCTLRAYNNAKWLKLGFIDKLLSDRVTL